MGKITAIETIQDLLYKFKKEGRFSIIESPKTSNPLVNVFMTSFLELEPEDILYLNKMNSYDNTKNLYLVCLENLKSYSDKNGHEFVKSFHTKIDETDYTILSVHPDFLKYETGGDLINIFKNMERFVNTVVSSGVLRVNKNDFNVLERDYLVFMLIHDLFVKEHPEQLKADIKALCILEELYKDSFRSEFGDIDGLFKYLGEATDNYELLSGLFIELKYLYFTDKFTMEEYEEWEREYRSHS